MSSNESNRPGDAPDSEVSLPIADIRRSEVEAADAEKVKGGAIEITDYGFGVSMPVSSSTSSGATIKSK